jgi:transcriptional regulator GlxA family with amidase domain
MSFPVGPVSIPVDDTIRPLLARVIHAHKQPAADARDHQLLHIGAALLHVVFASLGASAPQALPDSLLSVLALIARAPHAKLTNQLLAERAGMSVERFIRTFRDHTGTTPAAYVLRTRVRLAGEALALTDKTIDQIAVETGFPNRHYLTRMFARHVGCGPAEFRLRQRDKRGQ